MKTRVIVPSPKVPFEHSRRRSGLTRSFPPEHRRFHTERLPDEESPCLRRAPSNATLPVARERLRPGPPPLRGPELNFASGRNVRESASRHVRAVRRCRHGQNGLLESAGKETQQLAA